MRFNWENYSFGKFFFRLLTQRHNFVKEQQEEDNYYIKQLFQIHCRHVDKKKMRFKGFMYCEIDCCSKKKNK